MALHYSRIVLAAILLSGGTAGVFAQSKPLAEEGKPEAVGTTGQANDPRDPPSVREHYSAPNGGMSSGAHTGNESPTKKGNSANDANASENDANASEIDKQMKR